MSEDMYAANHGNVTDYFQDFSDQEAADAWVTQALTEINAGEKIEYAVYLDKQFAGLISLRDLTTSTPEIGLWISPQHQGKGLGVESVKWLLAWAKIHLPHAEKLIYDAKAQNTASNRLAIAGGLSFVKEYVESNVTYRQYIYPLS